MTASVKRTAAAMAVTDRVGRIAMGARHPIAWQWLICRMRPAMCKELGQNMRVRTFRTLPVGRRNSLEDLHATHAADKNTMRVGVQNNGHGTAVRCEYGFSDMPSKCGGNSWIAGADESINLQQPKPEVEKDSRSILRS